MSGLFVYLESTRKKSEGWRRVTVYLGVMELFTIKWASRLREFSTDGRSMPAGPVCPTPGGRVRWPAVSLVHVRSKRCLCVCVCICARARALTGEQEGCKQFTAVRFRATTTMAMNRSANLIGNVPSRKWCPSPWLF